MSDAHACVLEADSLLQGRPKISSDTCWLNFDSLLVPFWYRLVTCFMIFKEFGYLPEFVWRIAARFWQYLAKKWLPPPASIQSCRRSPRRYNGSLNWPSGAKMIQKHYAALTFLLFLVLGCILVTLWLTSDTLLVPFWFQLVPFCMIFNDSSARFCQYLAKKVVAPKRQPSIQRCRRSPRRYTCTRNPKWCWKGISKFIRCSLLYVPEPTSN